MQSSFNKKRLPCGSLIFFILLSGWFVHHGFVFLLAIDDAAAGEIVRAHFYLYVVTEQNSDVIPAHTTGKIGEHYMAIFELYPELCSGQGFDDLAFNLDLVFFFGHNSPDQPIGDVTTYRSAKLFANLGELAAFDAADGFLLLHSAKFALGNKPALLADGAENTALDNFFTEAFQQ